ncbi:YhcN/YlaJ family sporulation lipoprotein [Litchfieldia salsa]|uniref:Sporulation lipoprotein YhcN/YlaJ (Spore_YhcN_YlaJ) n=1 Tax=Litchfieldia salsa TaxID=930152 RepID=A0A1H0S2Q2_9BACI|nr:YhcN/YlaJ family sporulation lipoprotein [Litchfieldia salsa]SDP36023.1 Sporulation lipoprotein YhcN/YlaJ (Spore_YhcN_YlaJ) [Litchfieldia salsa]
MTKKSFLVVVLVILFISACANQENQGSSSNHLEEMNTLQTRSSGMKEQEIAKEAEREILSYKEVVDVVAVNNKDKLLVGFKIKQFSKFKTKDIEAKINKKLKEEFPNYETNAASDLKIFIETIKIKKEILEGTINQKDLDKRMGKIIKLSKEQT